VTQILFVNFAASVIPKSFPPQSPSLPHFLGLIFFTDFMTISISSSDFEHPRSSVLYHGSRFCMTVCHTMTFESYKVHFTHPGYLQIIRVKFVC